MKYGDDKALSMGGSLPGEVVNGLVDHYAQLCKTGNPVFVVAVLEVDYIKTYKNGRKPDEPVLKLVRVEVGQGETQAAILTLIDQLQAERTGEPSLASSQQGQLEIGVPTA